MLARTARSLSLCVCSVALRAAPRRVLKPARQSTRLYHALASMGHGGGGSTAAAPSVDKFRKDYAALPYGIDAVDLDFNVQDEETLVTSTLTITPQGGGPLVLDGEDLRLVSAEVDGVALAKDAFSIEEETFTLHAPPSKPFTLKTVVGIEPAKNTQLSGLYESSGNLCTQCEAEGFRRITYFYDRPDCMSMFTSRVEADRKKFPILLSNGNAVATGEHGDRHWASFEDPFKKPSYLFALVAGDLGGIQGSFTTKSGRNVDLRIWSEHANCDQLDWSLESLKRAMTWDEETYGLEYDLDVYHVVAVNDFNMGVRARVLLKRGDARWR